MRQGNDVGTQYRSVIYTNNDDDLKVALESKDTYQKELVENNFKADNLESITTEIEPVKNYYLAEEYHQQYLASKGCRQYCSASPTKVKLRNFNGSNYKLKDHIWENFNWEVEKCVLRSDNNPIKNNI